METRKIIHRIIANDAVMYRDIIGKFMTNDKLDDAIKSVGMETFVKYYEAFIDDTKCSDDIHDALMKLEGFGDNSARTKVNAARRIIKNHMKSNALEIIRDRKNKRVAAWVSAKAQHLLESNI